MTEILKKTSKIFSPHSLFWFRHQLTRINSKKKEKELQNKTDHQVTFPPENDVNTEPYSNVWEEAWNVTKRLIKRIKNESRAAGSDFLVVLVTNSDSEIMGELADPLRSPIGNHAENHLKILSEFTHKEKIDFLPLLPGFQENLKSKNQKFHYTLDGHWNPQGHRLAAELIFRYLTQNQLKNSVQSNLNDIGMD